MTEGHRKNVPKVCRESGALKDVVETERTGVRFFYSKLYAARWCHEYPSRIRKNGLLFQVANSGNLEYNHHMKLLSGSSNLPLAQSIAQGLQIPLVNAEITHFANNERRVWIKDDVRGENVVLVQSFSERGWGGGLLGLQCKKKNHQGLLVLHISSTFRSAQF